MPAPRRACWLIAYDIRDARRLARVGRTMAKAAFRLQDSLYTADLADAERDRLAARLLRMIDASVDDLRFYPVPHPPFGGWSGPDPETSAPEIFAFCSLSATLVFKLRRQNMNKINT